MSDCQEVNNQEKTANFLPPQLFKKQRTEMRRVVSLFQKGGIDVGKELQSDKICTAVQIDLYCGMAWGELRYKVIYTAERFQTFFSQQSDVWQSCQKW